MTITIARTTISINLTLFVVGKLSITIAITTQPISMNLLLLVKTIIHHYIWICMMGLSSNVPFKSVLVTIRGVVGKGLKPAQYLPSRLT